MKHYLLIKSAGHSADGNQMTARDSALALLRNGAWPLWDHTRNRKAIAGGDVVAVYLSGTGQSEVFATAKVEAVVPWSTAFAKKYPLVLDGIPFSVLKLSDVMVLDRPVVVKDRLSQLSFVNQDSRKWGVCFMGGTRAVNAADFDALTSNS